ncbi:MAG TPA: outer membrane protein assembly factor BamE [Castellaniella sp.]|uniref:outer membrane protein assembly factor BamE n=1 Tax=Castellaniella sp. TaxID=1955812 RepID=UPI002EFE2B71
MLTLALAGCGSTNWGFPYRATVQQGNWITSEQVAQLEVGMTRDQVKFILGTPTLEDAFHADRWDYPFYNQPGYGKDELRKFTVWFKDDKLVRWSGDAQPDRQPFQKIDNGREAIQKEGTPKANPPAVAAPAQGTDTTAAPTDTTATPAPSAIPVPAMPAPVPAQPTPAPGGQQQ